MTRLVVLVVCGTLLPDAARAEEPDDPVAALIAQLADKDPKARSRAARELGCRGGARAVAALGDALDADPASVRHEAAIALARLTPDNPKVVKALIESLGNEDWYVRWQACLTLRALGPRAEDAVPALIDVLGDAKQDSGREAALALTAIAPRKPEVVDALLRALASGPERQAVIFALGRAGTAAGRAVPWLAREVHKNKHGSSVAAQRLLKRLVDDHVDQFLMLFAPDMGDRIRAANWFAGTAQHLHEWKEASVAALAEALNDESARVRAYALDALRELGKSANAKAAVPGILRSSVSKQKSERDEARQALEAIAPGLARMFEVYADGKGGWAAGLFFPPRENGSHAKALLALLLEPTYGDATLAALARITRRTKEELLEELRAQVAREADPKPRED